MSGHKPLYPSMMEIRLRSRIPDEEMLEKVGKIVTPTDYNVVLTGKIRVYQPNGNLLCVYLPGVLKTVLNDAYPVLHELKRFQTHNRGYASGSKRAPAEGRIRTDALPVASAIIGAFDPMGPARYCRLTAWTGQETEKWKSLHPLFQAINALFREHVPDRFAVQEQAAAETRPDWIVPGTVFTTITVNNTYPTGVHKDAGDLESGFSCLAVLRRGDYDGGLLTFPEYRVGVDLQDGDMILMDAHQWHGNTKIIPHCILNSFPHEGPCEPHGITPERISVVCYYRTKMATCETMAEENQKALTQAEERIRRGAEAGTETS